MSISKLWNASLSTLTNSVEAVGKVSLAANISADILVDLAVDYRETNRIESSARYQEVQAELTEKLAALGIQHTPKPQPSQNKPKTPLI
jgi:hypothetical protein